MDKAKLLKFGKLAIVPLLLVCGILLLTRGYDWRELIDGEGLQGWGIYLGLLIVLPLIGFPISAFYVFSGLAFSPWMGLGLTSAGLFINMIFGYWIGRWYLHEPLSNYLHRKERTRKWLHTGNLIRLTILVRAVPGVPYFMQNYILGLVKAPFWAYLFLSWIIQSLFCAGTIFLTSSGRHFRDLSSALPMALFGVGIFALIWFIKYRLKRSLPSEVDSKQSNDF
jgi:uncharacterized membrane protein YdjX (TVP38/TMEM64 family)